MFSDLLHLLLITYADSGIALSIWTTLIHSKQCGFLTRGNLRYLTWGRSPWGRPIFTHNQILRFLPKPNQIWLIVVNKTIKNGEYLSTDVLRNTYSADVLSSPASTSMSSEAASFLTSTPSVAIFTRNSPKLTIRDVTDLVNTRGRDVVTVEVGP